MQPALTSPSRIAVIGAGISGIAAAWLLGRRHEVTVFERESRLGGHANTVDVITAEGTTPVDTGFIVYNPSSYPNLTALFDVLGVRTQSSDMSFSVSRHGGALEYAGSSLNVLFAQRRNMANPRFWAMLRDVARFHRQAPVDLPDLAKSGLSLGEYLRRGGYGPAFRDDHLLPMAAAIWSSPTEVMADYPAAAFIRFFDNHGLLRFGNWPEWRTVVGGSKAYVARLTRGYADRARTGAQVTAITRTAAGVSITDATGQSATFDHAVIATHADQALQLLTDADAHERRLLGAFRYTRNLAVLHSDPALMPVRRAVWSSWNSVHRGSRGDGEAYVTYWMNRLQGIGGRLPLFVTLNPDPPPDPARVWRAETYTHPAFDQPAIEAQRALWSLQGHRRTWYCGCYFGAGFHEDGLQAGLAVAEDLGGVRRPWTVDGESDRIFRRPPAGRPALELAS